MAGTTTVGDGNIVAESLIPQQAPEQIVAEAKALAPHETRDERLEAILSPQPVTMAEMIGKFRLDKEAFLAESQEFLAEVVKVGPSVALKMIDEKTEEYFGAKVSEYVASVKEGSTDAENAAFAADRTKTVSNLVFVGLDGKSAEYDVWYQIRSEVADAKNMMFGEYLNSDKAKETMHPSAIVEYRNFREIGDAVNKFFLVWNRDAASKMSAAEREQAGFKDEVSTVREMGGELRELPWAKAFPEEIKRIVAAYNKTASEMEGLAAAADSEDDQKVYIQKAQYYKTVADAYTESSIDKFKEADTLLPGQSLWRADLPIHIHAIELGYGADGIQRVPEASLRFPDEEGELINKTALNTKKDMMRELQALFAEGKPNGEQYTQECVDTLKMVGQTTYLATHFHGAGMELDFLPVGQILPNESDCRIKGGVSVTANRSGAISRVPRYYEAFEAMFPPEVAAELFPRGSINPDIMNGTITASHEYGHAIGLTPSTTDRLGKFLIYSYAEEWKATVGGMILAEWRAYLNPDEAENPATMKTLKSSIITHIANAGRYTRARKNESTAPYLRKSLMIIATLEECGVLVKKGDTWTIDLSNENVIRTYETLEFQYKDLIEIYDIGEQQDLAMFLAENLYVSDFALHMQDSIDHTFPNDTKDAPDLEEFTLEVVTLTVKMAQ